MATPSDQHRWLRRRNVITALAVIVVVALGWVVIEAWRVYAGEPKATVDYAAQFRAKIELDLQQPPEVGDRSWESLEQALEIYRTVIAEIEAGVRVPGFEPRDEFDGGHVDFTLMRSGDPMRPELDRERRALAELQQAGLFETLRNFADQGVGFRPSDSTTMMMFAVHSDLNKSRGVAKALSARMRFCSLAGDYEGVVESFESAMAIGRTISHQPGTVNFLVGAAINSLVLAELTAELIERDFSEPVCVRLVEIMDRQHLADVAIALDGERAAFHDCLQWWFTDDGHGNGYMTATPLPNVETSEHKLLHAFMSRFMLADRVETGQTLDLFMDRCIEQARVPGAKRWRTFDPEQFVIGLGRRHALLRMVLPVMRKVVDNTSRIQQECDAMRIMLALEIYHARRGSWPASLDALPPEVLPEIPRDPLHGGPFGYRLVEADADGRAYLLYSFGLDQKDDGGVEDAADPYAIMRDRSAQGFDFVLSRPREKP